MHCYNNRQMTSKGLFFAIWAAVLFLFFTPYVQSIPLATGEKSAPDAFFIPSASSWYNSSKTTRLVKRGGGDLGGDPYIPSWPARQNTGRMLWCLMNSKLARQSEFTADDLDEYGWEAESVLNSVVEEFRDHIRPLYDQLGFNVDGEQAWGDMHINDWGVDDNGRPNQGTLGAYQNIYNGPQGYIIAYTNVAPAESGFVAPIPPLQKWSDITAFRWESVAAGQRLNYVVRDHIANWNTRMSIYNALRTAAQATLPTWPGSDFTINEDGTNPLASAFWGLLGTYHAAGPAYMLAQHKNIFGHKTITRIRIWDEERAWPISNTLDDLRAMTPNMLIYVDDVATDVEPMQG
ncbi:hypothetical protein F5B22DRAFT_622256 [Xylaria bambusicola]|uniref:uncharacterized protein n=1 Tax=Xylaria bambusicola TaxID=326684 RepID=UPI00200799CE|nr:uncharacterized protein F5B22DRAFT_622256 [Xylaria bambusicola]KAI0506841.1 hypothetical protein F5B22DRAFT_622256 [Xylaria bambusicola]